MHVDDWNNTETPVEFQNNQTTRHLYLTASRLGGTTSYRLVIWGSGYKINRGRENCNTQANLNNKSPSSYFHRRTFPLLVLSNSIW